jgi:hypothetical protein
MAVSVHLTFLLGVIEIDGMPTLQILRLLSSFLTSKKSSLKTRASFFQAA